MDFSFAGFFPTVIMLYCVWWVGKSKTLYWTEDSRTFRHNAGLHSQVCVWVEMNFVEIVRLPEVRSPIALSKAFFVCVCMYSYKWLMQLYQNGCFCRPFFRRNRLEKRQSEESLFYAINQSEFIGTQHCYTHNLQSTMNEISINYDCCGNNWRSLCDFNVILTMYSRYVWRMLRTEADAVEQRICHDLLGLEKCSCAIISLHFKPFRPFEWKQTMFNRRLENRRTNYAKKSPKIVSLWSTSSRQLIPTRHRNCMTSWTMRKKNRAHHTAARPNSNGKYWRIGNGCAR